jgi:intein-encoded DNA endonuclease-like protein
MDSSDMRLEYTPEQAEKIAATLRALPAMEPPPKKLTKAEVVKLLSKEIRDLQKRGYSLEQIASSLKGEGLDISTPTLKSYLAKSKPAKNNNPRPKKVKVENLEKEPVATASEPSNKKVNSKNTSKLPKPDSLDL